MQFLLVVTLENSIGVKFKIILKKFILTVRFPTDSTGFVLSQYEYNFTSFTFSCTV